ncbi:MAG: hypothetical protein CXT65_06195 [Methanobacteriota archaeon]|nr:MAG: hypothetical protein CXT65_06195 [Euryarchaeota archaeon]
MVEESEPPVLWAVITYSLRGCTEIGVPRREPSIWCNDTPSGRGGSIDQSVTSPPSEDGMTCTDTSMVQ